MIGIQEISTTERPHGLRWARIGYPDGSFVNVLQQEWVRDVQKVTDGRTVEIRREVEWRDVPIHHVLYESPR